MRRRTFLILGLPLGACARSSSLADEPEVRVRRAGREPEKAPRVATLREAFALAKRGGRSVVALCVPRDEDARRDLGQALFELVKFRSPDYWPLPMSEWNWKQAATELRACTVLVCLDAGDWAQCFPERAESAIVVFEPDASFARTRDLPADRYGKTFVRALHGAVFGDAYEHVAESEDRVPRRRWTERQRAMLDALAGAEPVAVGPRSEASGDWTRDDLAYVLDRSPWTLLHAIHRRRPEAPAPYVTQLLTPELGLERRELPFGVTMPDWKYGFCGSYFLPEDLPSEMRNPVAVMCGMAHPTREGRPYVRFLK